jgi:transcriptional regulator with XRE-family HTH domain
MSYNDLRELYHHPWGATTMRQTKKINLGAAIKAARLESGKKASEIYDALDVSKQQYYSWERWENEPLTENLYAIERAIGLPRQSLVNIKLYNDVIDEGAMPEALASWILDGPDIVQAFGLIKAGDMKGLIEWAAARL